MKLGIHHRPGSFSDKWIIYCQQNGVEYKLVDAYSYDIVSQLGDCDGFMWHWHQGDYRDQLFARQLILALEKGGKLVFPSSDTSWHFDDKVGQKYLLESVHFPVVNSFVFYEKEKALDWARTANFPKVFKLRGGAGP